MKPLEVADIADTEGEMECELPSKEFFVQIGMLVVEGRTPQPSERGRIEGKHCVSLKGTTSHVCEKKIKECQDAYSWKQQVEHHWNSMNPVVIDVLVQLTQKPSTILLLEQWTISIISGSYSHSKSGSQLLQAVRSHIHFSQLSAWLSLSRGALPYDIQYRMNREEECFIQGPILHVFPLASLPGQRSLQVTVKSLPRRSIQELIYELDTPSTCTTEDTRSPLRKRTCFKVLSSKSNRASKSSTELKELNVSCDSQCEKQSNLENDFLPLDKRLDINCPLESDQHIVRSNVSNLGAYCSNRDSNGIGNLNERIEKLGREIDQMERTVHPNDTRFSGLSTALKHLDTESKEDCGEKKLSKESGKRTIMTKSVTEKKQKNSDDMTKMLLQRKYRSVSEQGCHESAYDQIPTRQGTASNSSDVDIHAIKQSVNRACFRRSVQLPIGACTEPVFNPTTGLPVSSSPAPLRRSTNELYEDTTDFTDALSNKVDYRELSKLLSRSAPASTTQSLLVNFEESVLNGRMEPVGTVEGFTAELSASGSFCPRHVKLPIISCFYRLSDDDAPSPYMGYISLKDEPLGRRGYHVPTRGTIQLTVFNPNKTVVKMFVVLYDYSDMPPKSQTFLRQKTYSALKGNVVKNEAQQTLHYLVHLRFASSKSGKIYLHTDIRVIFARQPPDLGHLYKLNTITDGPTNPKYTKRHHIAMDPEC